MHLSTESEGEARSDVDSRSSPKVTISKLTLDNVRWCDTIHIRMDTQMSQTTIITETDHIADKLAELADDLRKRRDNEIMMASEVLGQYVTDHYDPKTETQEQGKLRCAQQMAKAETWALQEGYMFECLPDADADESFTDSEPQEYQDEWRGKAWVTLMYGPGGNIVQSLGGSYGDSHYKRVVRAEMALEEMPSEVLAQ